LHPWEFDPEQPRINVGGLSKFRHYVNLSKTASKLKRYIAAVGGIGLEEYFQKKCVVGHG
jgi:hypothetical protein